MTGCRLFGQGRVRRGWAEGGEEAQDHPPNAERSGSPGRRLPVAQVRAEGGQGQPPAEVKISLRLSDPEHFVTCTKPPTIVSCEFVMVLNACSLLNDVQELLQVHRGQLQGAQADREGVHRPQVRPDDVHRPPQPRSAGTGQQSRRGRLFC